MTEKKGRHVMKQGRLGGSTWGFMLLTTVLLYADAVPAQETGTKGSSYAPVDIKEDFAATLTRMKKAKPEVKTLSLSCVRCSDPLGTRGEVYSHFITQE
jgi:hypothetical protein